jgi:hypothetical protein
MIPTGTVVSARSQEKHARRTGLRSKMRRFTIRAERRMIWNVIDRRKSPFRWKTVDAAIEPTRHDDKVTDADKAATGTAESEFEDRRSVSLADAINWANSFSCPVTLYIYDAGELSVTYTRDEARDEMQRARRPWRAA